MAGRFSTHQIAAPALVPAFEEGLAETVSLNGMPEPAPEPPAPPPPAANPLLTEKLLDAKVRLHRRRPARVPARRRGALRTDLPWLYVLRCGRGAPVSEPGFKIAPTTT